MQVSIIGLIFRPLETWFPAEPWTDRKLTLVDRNYTLLMLLGIFPLFTYLVLTSFSHLFGGSDESTSSPLAFGEDYQQISVSHTDLHRFERAPVAQVIAEQATIGGDTTAEEALG